MTARPSDVMSLQGMFLVDCEELRVALDKMYTTGGAGAGPAGGEEGLAGQKAATNAALALAKRIGGSADSLDLLSATGVFVTDEMDSVFFARSELNLPWGKPVKPSPIAVGKRMGCVSVTGGAPKPRIILKVDSLTCCFKISSFHNVSEDCR